VFKLLFFDKKDLTNGNNWFIPCAMNANEISALIVCVLMLIIFRLVLRKSKNRAAKIRPTRLARVRDASLVFFACTSLCLLLGICWFIGFIFGWPFLGENHMRIAISPNHIYSSPSEMPPEIFWLFMVKNVLAFFAGGAMLRLFWLYYRGILFTAKNVSCIRFLGYYFCINWFVDYQIQGALRDMALSMTPIFVGFVIIFVAWIMDEGRKIQEEQELTV
jgi:hypothetical protein